MATNQVGVITPHIAALLDRSDLRDQPIFLGDSNIAHMQTSHPADFAKYGDQLTNILAAPDYVGVNQKDGSIEYVKEFLVDNEYVKIAVRISASGRFFARSLYVLNNNRVRNFIAKGTLKKT